MNLSPLFQSWPNQGLRAFIRSFINTTTQSFILLSVLLFNITVESAPKKSPPLNKKHAFSIEDMLAMERLSSPSISPDGSKVIFNSKRLAGGSYKSSNDLMLLDLANPKAAPKYFTQHKAADYSPVWSKDGSAVYFLSSRSGSSQVWRKSLSGDEAIQVTDLPLDVDTFKIDKANKQLLVSLTVYPDCDSLKCTVKRDKQIKSSKTSGVVYDKLFMRHWDHWLDGKQSHLFISSLSPKGVSSGSVTALTKSINANVPSKPFGGSEEYNFSPDGTVIYFAARVANREEAWSTNFDIYSVRTDGKSLAINLTADNLAWDTAPMVSPDGKYLAYLAMDTPKYEADNFQLKLRNIKTGKTKTLSEKWDRSISSYQFIDRHSLVVKAQHLGEKPLFSMNIKSGKVKQITKGGTVGGFDIYKDKIIFTQSHLKSPAELYSVTKKGKSQRQLTHVNRKVLAQTSMGSYEQFSFKGANNDIVYGYLVKPANFKKGKKYPLAFLIHGGPQGSFSNNFHYRWNPQAYAGAGYVSVMIDFHGSTGYGQDFTHSISKDWGEKPLIDLQKGLAFALKKYPFIDSERKCALGASYGGYMVNWIAGNWPNGFECLVNHDGIFDMRSMYYTTEELWFPEYEQGGPYFANPQQHEKHNPANYVTNWKTPMLVIQGELDYRVPLGQSLATFTALQRQGIESKFLYFPDENHWVLKPHNSVKWHNEVLLWLDKHLR
jgi:dipeptidyl aminopeptidase/acylaminoacyl peptidase